MRLIWIWCVGLGSLAAAAVAGCGGEDGSGCTVTENADGTATISCEDGTSFTVGSGEPGVDGEPGMDGEPGTDGSTALVNVTPEAAGENCADGGVRVDAGLDADGDGTLGDDEIDSTQYVCNGAGSTPTLVTVTDEAPGSECAAGGKRIDTGLDDGAGGETAGDGTLGAGEIDSTHYVCNGEDGADGVDGADAVATLITVTAESAGGTCAAGGQRIDTGLDNGDGGETAGDGVLGTGEIDSTEYICNGADGADGTDGADGADAVSTLVTVTTESAGGTCAAGGQRIDAGLDNGDGGGTAGDGVLSSGEIDTTAYVCNGTDGSDGAGGADGADGADGFDTLVSVTGEPGGSNCPVGGQRIDAGLDNGDGGGTARNGTLESGEIDTTAYVCHVADVLVPGATWSVSLDGWSVRCLSWSGDDCVHMQQTMDCGVCGTYTNCGVWHDVTQFNNGSNRTALNWCAIATGDSTVTSVGAGGTGSAPLGCGWSSTTHPICETGRASYHAAGFGISSNLGLLLDPAYCSGSTTLLTVECAGW